MKQKRVALGRPACAKAQGHKKQSSTLPWDGRQEEYPCCQAMEGSIWLLGSLETGPEGFPGGGANGGCEAEKKPGALQAVSPEGLVETGVWVYEGDGAAMAGKGELARTPAGPCLPAELKGGGVWLAAHMVRGGGTSSYGIAMTTMWHESRRPPGGWQEPVQGTSAYHCSHRKVKAKVTPADHYN